MNESVTRVAERTLTTLDVFREDRPLVLEFWNTRCVECSTALAKVDNLASIVFVACALSIGFTTRGTIDYIEELVVGTFPNLEHVYMDFDTKERIKNILQFASLPFAVAYDSHANIVCQGDPMSAEFDSALNEFLRRCQTRADASE